MFATLVRLSKALRRPLTPKRGNKDFYKGTRQAFLPGGHRTGAPGKHVIGGKAKYRLVDEQVRYYVAPPIEEIVNSPLRAYVEKSAKVTPKQRRAVYGNLPRGGITGAHYFKIAPRETVDVDSISEESLSLPVKDGSVTGGGSVSA